jgi:hypothetical protein
VPDGRGERGVHVDAVGPGGGGPGGLVRDTEELGGQPDRVTADVVQRAALQFPRIPDVAWVAELEVEPAGGEPTMKWSRSADKYGRREACR